MPPSRIRLSDAEVAALARSHFGLSAEVPDIPTAAEYEDAQGVLVAVRDGDRVVVVEVPRWRSPVDVATRLAQRGWPAPEGWIGLPPADVSELPSRVLALLPVAGAPSDSVAISTASAAWASVKGSDREVELALVPVTAAAPELTWPALAAAYGATLAGSGAVPVPDTGATGTVVLFTGLSGAGKSTIAARVVELLLEEGHGVTSLDGDEVRHHLSAGLGFSRADRDTNVARIGWVAARIAKHGGIAVCAPIAPYASVRAEVRREVEAQAGPGSFVLVHVATSLADCESRDRKGLYAKARRGEIAEFTGVSDPYEVPTDAEVTVETAGRTVDECARQVLAHLV